MKIFQVKRYVIKQLLVTLCVNIGITLTGFTIVWTTIAVPKLQDPDQTPLSYTISMRQASWIGTCFILGAVTGMIIFANLSDRFGRKLCLVTGGVVVIAGAMLTMFSKEFSLILVGRFLWGAGQGTIYVNSLILLGEVASSNIRGVILSSSSVFLCLGSLLMYSIGPLLSYSGIGYVFLVICGIHQLGLIYVPESPLYYILKGNEKAALVVLNKLGRGENTEIEIKNINNDALKIQNKIRAWKEIFTIQSNRKALAMTISLCILQECSGILAVGMFVTTIFQKAGSSIDPNMATIIVGLTQLITTMIAPCFIEKLGRKTLLLISSAGCSICMGLLGIYFYLDYIKNTVINSLGWLPLLLLVMAYCTYNFGLNTVPNILIGELYCPNVRSVGASISITIGWIFAALSVLAFGYIVEAIGIFVILWIFSFINSLTFIFSLFVVPETTGLSLIEIQNLL